MQKHGAEIKTATTTAMFDLKNNAGHNRLLNARDGGVGRKWTNINLLLGIFCIKYDGMKYERKIYDGIKYQEIEYNIKYYINYMNIIRWNQIFLFLFISGQCTQLIFIWEICI